MPRIRTIKGVLNNFLATYTSRYSDFDGYWIFGLLTDVEHVTIDLLGKEPVAVKVSPVSVAIPLAQQRFEEQMSKVGLPISLLREASLEISIFNDTAMVSVNGRTCIGQRVRFHIKVISENGKKFESTKAVFVAPHNPNIETRSTRRI